MTTFIRSIYCVYRNNCSQYTLHIAVLLSLGPSGREFESPISDHKKQPFSFENGCFYYFFSYSSTLQRSFGFIQIILIVLLPTIPLFSIKITFKLKRHNGFCFDTVTVMPYFLLSISSLIPQQILCDLREYIRW